MFNRVYLLLGKATLDVIVTRRGCLSCATGCIRVGDG